MCTKNYRNRELRFWDIRPGPDPPRRFRYMLFHSFVPVTWERGVGRQNYIRTKSCSDMSTYYSQNIAPPRCHLEKVSRTHQFWTLTISSKIRPFFLSSSTDLCVILTMLFESVFEWVFDWSGSFLVCMAYGWSGVDARSSLRRCMRRRIWMVWSKFFQLE